MCTAIREMMEDSRAEGIQIGMIKTYISLGYTPEEISRREQMDINRVEEIETKKIKIYLLTPHTERVWGFYGILSVLCKPCANRKTSQLCGLQPFLLCKNDPIVIIF